MSNLARKIGEDVSNVKARVSVLGLIVFNGSILDRSTLEKILELYDYNLIWISGSTLTWEAKAQAEPRRQNPRRQNPRRQNPRRQNPGDRTRETEPEETEPEETEPEETEPEETEPEETEPEETEPEETEPEETEPEETEPEETEPKETAPKPKELFIGFDLGTSSSKVVIGDSASGKRYPVEFRPNEEGIEKYFQPTTYGKCWGSCLLMKAWAIEQILKCD